MQPFDALTMRAVLQEAKPLLVSRKVEKIYQLGRDEIILAFRQKTGSGHFLLSAQASFGRLCLINLPVLPKHVNPPAFCQLLRKHLTGATLMDIHQIEGERVADLNFSCVDELGTRTNKVLTAEVMGRHSNLIFWDKDTQKIIGASHVVTQEMSRQREVGPGLLYVRPPRQEKPSVFQVTEPEFKQLFEKLRAGETPTIAVIAHVPGESTGGADENVKTQQPVSTLEQWLISTFSGMGRHLAEEVVSAAHLSDDLSAAIAAGSGAEIKLWRQLLAMQQTAQFKPAMKTDLARHTVLSWWSELQSGGGAEWKQHSTVNEMVDDYFRTLQLREQMQQLRDRIRSELRSESDKVEGRLAAAEKQLESQLDVQDLKKCGDLILANVGNIQAGQSELICEDLYVAAGSASNGAEQVSITLNPNLSPAQNAQHYYRQFAKARVRHKAASVAKNDAAARMEVVRQHVVALEQAKGPEELNRLKEMILDRGRKLEHQSRNASAPLKGGGAVRPAQQQQHPSGAVNKAPRLLSTKSSDGWVIYIGKNKNENDVLISRLAQPQDIWLHVQGTEGAHVLIKNPNKQDPPQTTLREAAQLAARFSRVSFGSKVRVIYTYVKYVRKLGKDKPGLVRYENEKTIEVDTSAPIPPNLKNLLTK